MDIYRFFHPHHNPRLHSSPLRQQELSELEQVSSELLKALVRAQSRARRSGIAPIMPELFDDIIKATRFVSSSLQTLCDAHPGDSSTELGSMICERAGLPGWESWRMVLSEQLSSENGQ